MTSFIGTVTASVVLIALLVVVVSEVGVQAGGSTFEVNQVENAISQGDGTCDGTCSLRDAILAANSNPGPDTIVFASEVFAPGSGNDNIITPDPLPAIDGSEGITIDGTGAEVVIVGFELNTAGDGLRFISGASEVLHDVTVRNLSIGYFKNGISVCAAPSGELCTFEATDIVIEDVMTFENEVHGIDIGRGATVTNVMVTRVEANVNGGIGIDIEGESIAGVDLTDTDATGNGSHGVSIAANDDASGISMVDSTFVENASRGAQIVSSSGHVRNALVADSDFTDNASLGQSLYITSFDGLQGIEVGDNTVGGPRQGIYMSSAVGGIDVHDNQVEGGTQGIRVVGPGGGTVRILENQVTGGSEEGISTSLDSATTQLEVSGNFVENDGAGSGPAAGIWLGSSTTPAVPYVIEGNEVTGNSGDGIGIWGVANATISRNSTYLNGELGIDLVVDSELPPGVTFNDAGDGDAGPNGLLNTPEWEGGADACPNCLIEIFQSDNDPSGFGEGMQFLAEVTAEATGDFLPALCSLDLAVGTKITATATDQQGHTSEFSPTYPWSGSEPCPTPTPTPTPSATPTPTVTPTATSSASPTSTATSLQTSTPTATPSATSQSGAVWGDSDCDGDVSSRDNQALLRRVLSQPPLSQTEPCADLGDEVMIDGLPRSWGDWDCNGGISSRDNQALLRRVLSQNALSQTEPCPDLGTQS